MKAGLRRDALDVHGFHGFHGGIRGRAMTAHTLLPPCSGRRLTSVDGGR
ncbi:hypothetical protein [Streptacidiphilus carbonis]|nr:hypothetical protein [Streptacidiphilus carbonis]